ncbi:hypothetical protein PGB90_009028 [Kerria lacca]
MSSKEEGKCYLLIDARDELLYVATISSCPLCSFIPLVWITRLFQAGGGGRLEVIQSPLPDNKCSALIEEGYHSTNPYHNSIHATDVTQAMHCFLQEEKIRKYITPLEVMASLIAAVSHDLDHPGVNQPFLIATSNHLAALYQNTSVLENHHWRSAVGCLLESHVADQLRNIMPELERQISSLILATDITRQQEFLTKFKKYLNQNSLRMEKEEDRHFVLQIALKCADISNPCRPWEISRKWSQKVCEEFFRQGDYEQQLGLPLTALCDRSSSSVPKIQSGFFKFVVIPLFDEWHRFLGTTLSTGMMAHLRANHRKWEMLLQQELAEETRTEISDADEILNEESSELEIESQIESRRCSLPSVMLETVDRTGRRHSVPLNLSRDYSIPSTSSGRRESLPSSVEPRHKLVLEPIAHLEEEEEELDFSYRSSCSGSLQKSSDCGSAEERPVSAESLLPEPTIATITSSLEATRLSNVLHGSTMLAPPVSKILTRQQTFPPIQTFVRTRYLSTAGEIVAQPSASNSSSTDSSRNELSSGMRTGSSGSEPGEVVYNLKRDSSSSESDRGNKIPKFSEKENVNPRREHESRRHGSLQELLLPRRGSAPVSHEGTSLSRERDKSTPRRGSVPSESSRPGFFIPTGLTENKGIRRSSLPFDLLNQFNFSFNTTVLTFYSDSLEIQRRSSDGGKGSRRSSRNRKSLKRRSSGGPDILIPREKFNVPRRGSLPCDVLPTYIKSPPSDFATEK